MAEINVDIDAKCNQCGEEVEALEHAIKLLEQESV